ncbi:tetraacyldisaccharide 4'-kinase [Rickettsia endosymbiont of Halotydeus destructor]|uniref:tetraacyldisaccharide 4'-kinase n=1 Tax=Rickettsia endosymbiont of Halotydeus destructor TaxID=2996754 RepID=UPI003BB16603
MFKLIYPKFWQSRNIIAYLLWHLSLIYLLVSFLRKLFARPIIFPAKIICVGNNSVGGTGKTQIVIHLAKLLSVENIKFVIVTKAYGSDLTTAIIVRKHHTAIEVGDESLILSKYGTVIATRKIQQIIPLINEIKPSVIIVDDFLQNPNFHKDCTILAVDAHRLFGNGFLIPAGPLREYPKKALKSADLIMAISAENWNPPNILMSYTAKLVQAKIVLSKKIDKTKNYFAFSGIGNPERFFLTLKNYGLTIAGCEIFPDHYNYSKKDLENLLANAKKYNAALITTRKDYVKLLPLKDADTEIICCDVELLIDNPQKLDDLLYAKIFKKY